MYALNSRDILDSLKTNINSNIQMLDSLAPIFAKHVDDVVALELTIKKYRWVLDGLTTHPSIPHSTIVYLNEQVKPFILYCLADPSNLLSKVYVSEMRESSARILEQNKHMYSLTCQRINYLVQNIKSTEWVILDGVETVLNFNEISQTDVDSVSNGVPISGFNLEEYTVKDHIRIRVPYASHETGNVILSLLGSTVGVRVYRETNSGTWVIEIDLSDGES